MVRLVSPYHSVLRKEMLMKKKMLRLTKLAEGIYYGPAHSAVQRTPRTRSVAECTTVLLRSVDVYKASSPGLLTTVDQCS